MEAQTLEQRKQLLQHRIFAHPCIQKFNSFSQSIFKKLQDCHTEKMGSHTYRCDCKNCEHLHTQYHCCGNRHCPNCGGAKREQWIDARMCELLPTKYYHIVFTLPQELRSLCMGNRKSMFDLLFDATHYTLLKLARDPQWMGATPGIVSILHTHGQDLNFHPHIHCILSGGGVDMHQKWKNQTRKSGNFIFPRRAMELIFKAYFLKKIRLLHHQKILKIKDEKEYENVIEIVGNKKWNVYAKAPFGGPAQIIEYLGRYTHKVAITAHRIVSIDEKNIRFAYKDYADGNKKKEMVLSHEEFLRRYEQHILPHRFVKIRHAGFLSNKGKKKRIESLHTQLQLPAPMPMVQIPMALRTMLKTGVDISLCPKCKTGKMILISTTPAQRESYQTRKKHHTRGSPTQIISL